jgi:hypothetical protein
MMIKHLFEKVNTANRVFQQTKKGYFGRTLARPAIPSGSASAGPGRAMMLPIAVEVGLSTIDIAHPQNPTFV